jgi:hypothetical protein
MTEALTICTYDWLPEGKSGPHSITYRVAVGRRAGQKVFSLPSVPAQERRLHGDATASG